MKSPENIIDDEPVDQNYTVRVQQFTSTEMMIKVEMSDPLQVSNGFTRDQLLVKMEDTSWFVSAETGK